MEWKEIEKEHLEKLYYEDKLLDSQIAEMFNVSKGKVRYKRQKYGINMYQKIFKDFMAGNHEIFKQLNEDSKKRVCCKENINDLSIALTHYVFRNGPVESMHTDGKLT